MVKLGLISDSHDRSAYVERFLCIAKREKFDAIFFMGDGERDARWLQRRLNIPLQYVAGNCDMMSKVSREIFAQYERHRLIAVHGHLHDVKYGLDRLSNYAEAHGADIALYGHTHVPSACYVGPTLMLNPGALMDGCYGELLLDGRRVVPHLLNMRT